MCLSRMRRVSARSNKINLRVLLKFIDLYLSRQACKLSFIRVTGKFLSFSLSVLKVVFLGVAEDRDGGGVLNGGGGGGSINEKIFLVFKEEDSGQDSVSAFLFT